MTSITRPFDWPNRVAWNAVFGLGCLAVAAFFVVPAGPRIPVLAGLLLAVGGLTLAEVGVRLVTLDETSSNHRDKMLRMLERAERRIIATSGHLNASAWVDWESGSVPRVLAAKAARGVRIELLCQSIDARTRSVLLGIQARFPGSVHIYQNRSENPVPHGLLVDDVALRLEQPHDWASQTRGNAYIRQPNIAAAVFLAAFEDYKDAAEEVRATE
jgi:hypothetical protein